MTQPNEPEATSVPPGVAPPPAAPPAAPTLRACALGAVVVIAILEGMGIRTILFDRESMGFVDWLRAALVYGGFVLVVLVRWDRVEPTVRDPRFYVALLGLGSLWYAICLPLGAKVGDTIFDRGDAVVDVSAVRTVKGAHPSGPPELHWSLPDDWEALPPSEMRRLNARVRGEPTTECYLTILRAGGGGVLANVNRWRAQVGQPELDAAALATAEYRSLLRIPAVVVDATGTFDSGMGGAPRTDTTVLGLIAEIPTGDLMTLKMTGPAAVVARHRDQFFALAASLELRRDDEPPGSGRRPTPQPAAPDAAPVDTPEPPTAREPAVADEREGAASGIAWTLPARWSRTPDRPFLAAAFRLEGANGTECTLSTLRGDGGGLLANLNRWRTQQMGLPAIDEATAAALPKIPMLGGEGVFADLAGRFAGGMGGQPAIDDARMLVAIAFLTDQVVVVKLTGPAADVAAARADFDTFVASLRRVP
jgi:hypothetical protein